MLIKSACLLCLFIPSVNADNAPAFVNKLTAVFSVHMYDFTHLNLGLYSGPAVADRIKVSTRQTRHKSDETC